MECLYFRNYAVLPIHQLLLTLRFYAAGDLYICIGDFGGIHKTTMGKIIKRVTQAIKSLYRQYIHMPHGEQILRTKSEFHDVARFPDVIGAIDGTHIRIKSLGNLILFTYHLNINND